MGPNRKPLETAIKELESLLGEDTDDDKVYATMEFEEAEAMGSMSPDDWYAQTRHARAHKVARMIGERRRSRYFRLKRELEHELKRR